MALRDSVLCPPGRVIDVQFADFMRDPCATIKRHVSAGWAAN